MYQKELKSTIGLKRRSDMHFIKKRKLIESTKEPVTLFVKFDRSLEKFVKLYSILLCKIFAVQVNWTRFSQSQPAKIFVDLSFAADAKTNRINTLAHPSISKWYKYKMHQHKSTRQQQVPNRVYRDLHLSFLLVVIKAISLVLCSRAWGHFWNIQKWWIPLTISIFL